MRAPPEAEAEEELLLLTLSTEIWIRGVRRVNREVDYVNGGEKGGMKICDASSKDGHHHSEGSCEVYCV